MPTIKATASLALGMVEVNRRSTGSRLGRLDGRDLLAMTQHSVCMICDPQLLASRLIRRLSSQWIYFFVWSRAESNRVKRVSVAMFFVPLGACLRRPRRGNGKKPGPTQRVEAYATLLQVFATAKIGVRYAPRARAVCLATRCATARTREPQSTTGV